MPERETPMVSLNIPKRNDPFARLALFALFALALWANVRQFAVAPESAAASPGYTIIEQQSPTPAIPTPALAVGLALPTPTAPAAPADPQAPIVANWLDQSLDGVAASADQFAADQAAALADEQAASQAADEQAQYLANVGAQAAHSPRGDVPAPPPSFDAGPVALPPENGVQTVIDPNPAPAPLVAAELVPTTTAAQAAIGLSRESNGCAPGQVFYPRTGCHTPGSGGPQPGAVGETRP
jgi:hypothetical protein